MLFWQKATAFFLLHFDMESAVYSSQKTNQHMAMSPSDQTVEFEVSAEEERKAL